MKILYTKNADIPKAIQCRDAIKRTYHSFWLPESVGDYSLADACCHYEKNGTISTKT